MTAELKIPHRSKLAERIFAWLWGHAHNQLEKVYGKPKVALFSGLSGRVLEIGPGAGINLEHYPKDIQLTGVEPNVFMHPLLRDAAHKTGIAIEIVEGYAETLPMEDAVFDAIVSTLVLCSVFEQERVLREVLRVLRPGGKFYFIEHVAAPQGTRLRGVQDWIAPFWRCVGDGCNPNRETWQTLQQAGFSSLELEHRSFRVPLIPVRPHILGIATK